MVIFRWEMRFITLLLWTKVEQIHIKKIFSCWEKKKWQIHIKKNILFFPLKKKSDTQPGIEPLIRGMATQLQSEVDINFVDDIRNFLFGPPGAGGFDLVCLNTARGRDHVHHLHSLT